MKRSPVKTLAIALAVAAFAASGMTLAGDHHGDHAKKAFLGVSLAQVQNIQNAEKNGIYIAGVYDGSGAEAAGLKAHDRLLMVDGRKVSSHGDVVDALSAMKEGDSVEVVVLRGDDEMTFDVVLSDLPANTFHLKVPRGPHFVFETEDSKRPVLGIHAMSLSGQLQKYFDVEGGALVTEVVEDGAAWKAGIRAGDIITVWNGSAIEDMGAIHARLAKSKAGDVADLEVIRRGSVERFSVTLAEGSMERHHEIKIEMKGDEGMMIDGHGAEMRWIQKEDEDQE